LVFISASATFDSCTTTLFDYNRALLGLALLSSKHFCIFDVHGSVYIPVVIFGGVTSFSLPFSELTWLTNHHPSLLWHCWLGHLTREIVSEMTYNVSSVLLNPTVPYQLCSCCY